MNVSIPKITEKTPAFPKAETIMRGVITAFLACAKLPGMMPAGLAYAAAFAPENLLTAFAGLCVGMIADKTGTVKYLVAFLFYSVILYIKKPVNIKINALMLGICSAAAELLSFIWEGASAQKAVLLVPEAVITAAVFLLIKQEGKHTEVGRMADLAIIGGILNAVSGVTMPYLNMNISVFAVFFCAMCAGYAFEAPYAVFYSFILSAVTNLNNPACVAETGMTAVGALVASAMAGWGKAGCSAGFLCGITLCVLYRGNLGDMHTADIFVPIAVFALVPENVHCRISNALAGHAESGGDEENMRVASRLRTVAQAVCNLADGVKLMPGEDREEYEKRQVFDTVSARVCGGCRLEKSCRYGKKYESMNELWRVMERDGFCDSTNMPNTFRQVCMRSESFLREFAHAYEIYKQNILYRGEAMSERDIVARQYGEISNVITMLSHEVERGKCDNDGVKKFRAEINFAQEPKCGQSVCGDALIHFELGTKYYVILCDGMGCGESAFAESRLTARMFEEFLKAGFKKETAVNMINSALALKADKESFSTADLLEADLETGVCEFLKVGSAQSFIKTKSAVEIISSRALPVGILEKVEVRTEKRVMKNNDLILMLSDGAGEAGSGVLKNDWIKALLASEKNNDAELAEQVIAGARARMKFSDDITAVTVRIRSNRGGV